MTADDLVDSASDEREGKSGSTVAAERGDVPEVATPLLSAAPNVAPDAIATNVPNTADFDIRKFTAAIMGAKSGCDINQIIGECSRTLRHLSCSSKASGRGSETLDAENSSAGESRNSQPEFVPENSSGTGNALLTASTKSYSWSSSLPNGSALETLSSKTSDKLPEECCLQPAAKVFGSSHALPVTASGSSNINAEVSSENDTAPLTTGRSTELQSLHCDDDVSLRDVDGGHRTAGDGGNVAAVTSLGSIGSQRSSSKKVRVGDFLQKRDAASDSPFNSPRMSHIERQSRSRRFEHSLDQSLFSGNFFQPVAEAGNPLMSTPASAPAPNSGVHGIASRGVNYLLSAVDHHADSLTGSRHFASAALVPDVQSLSGLHTAVSMSTIVDNTLALTTRTLDDTTVGRLSSTVVDLAVSGSELTFAGRISRLEHPSGQASPTANISSPRQRGQPSPFLFL